MSRWKYRIRIFGLCATCFSLGLVVANESSEWSVMILATIWLLWFAAYDEYAFNKAQKRPTPPAS